MADGKPGRPETVTPEVVQQLKYAFAKGCSVVEACLFAEIARSVFYAYCDRNPGFLDSCEELRQKPMLKARMNIVESIDNGDLNTSKWYAERKAKSEFAQAVIATPTDNAIQFVVEKDDEKL